MTKNIFNYRSFHTLILLLFLCVSVFSQGTRLLRQPTISSEHIAFVYGGDIWRSDLQGDHVLRITSTPAVESNPHFSPDGNWIAFSSNRSGSNAVYVVAKEGGTPTRLTWHPSSAYVRGWSRDGTQILYATGRESAPTPYNRLWTVSVKGGPSTKIMEQWSYDGSFSPDMKQIVIDRVSRWDVEWRAYRGGQNTPLIIYNLDDHSETLLPNDRTTDIQPVWVKDDIYFLSDRDWTMNVWAYSTKTSDLRQVTRFATTDVKWLGHGNGQLIIEQNGFLHLLDPGSGNTTQLEIQVSGDFPWAETKWEDVSNRARSVSLSPTGKRTLMEARGEIFTFPVEHGDPRNLTQSGGAADRAPIWSPKGDQIAWFSDEGGNGYALHLTNQDGLSEAKTLSIGASKMAWNPVWSPDGKYIAFTDDDVRIRIIELSNGNLMTIDTGGNNLDRSRTGLAWAPDSKKIAYVKSGNNHFRNIMIHDMDTKQSQQLTNPFADAFAPAWDRDKKHFYFLASTDLALGSGWANTSAMQADPDYAAYVVVLKKDQKSPFIPRSDEEEVKKEEEKKEAKDNEENEEKKKSSKKKSKKTKNEDKTDKAESTKKDSTESIKIDFENIERRTIALDMPVANYFATASGPSGSVFFAERKPGSPGAVLQKFTLKERKAKEFLTGVRQFSISADGKKMVVNAGGWKVVNTSGASGKNGESFSVKLKMKLDRLKEWNQIFEEAWRYEKDYFYDPDLHGRDWQQVYERYAPLVPFIRHRSDLSYILDQVNGELSVGHSFVFGGDFPKVESAAVGLLGADLVEKSNRWQIQRIYTTESWNPRLSSPLDRPGLKVQEGHYLVGINGKELTSATDPYELLDGTRGQQTTIHLNDKPEFDSAWKEIVEPISSEYALRQRAWVEDNRRMVEKLSNGRLAYVWVPNTGGGGFVSFNRYFFAQQDKEGAVIDERFNGGGLLDDYMVDLMTRSLRAAITNEVPNGKPFRLPAGILGPKVLLINEMAGSGGDFFPWVFRQQQAGPLIGSRTWGGLVKSSVHYALIDGGALTSPDNAVFDPINNQYIGENVGIPPDIAVRQDGQALAEGRDPQLERAVEEVLKLLERNPEVKISPPPFNTPAKKN